MLYPRNAFLLSVAGALGFFQGIIWSILALVAIISHFAIPQTKNVTLETDSLTTIAKDLFHFLFINKNAATSAVFIITPKPFFVFMLLYFLLSLLWTFVSTFILIGLKTQGTARQLSLRALSWVVVSGLLLVLDLVFCCLLGADYHTFRKSYNAEVDVKNRLYLLFYINSYGIMMVLAARGFLLWIINLIVTILLGFSYWQNRHPENDHSYLYPDNWGSTRNIPPELSTSPGPKKNLRSDLSTDSFYMAFKYDPEIEQRIEKYNVKSG